MNDMTAVIVPKSDQINADDLIAGPMTITIREVRIKAGEEQPVSMYFEGSNKAFRPCKSMSRALVQLWGPDAAKYIGRSLTLYRDPKVRFGKDEVGGIRISHASHIEERQVLQLTATRGQRKPHKIDPLKVEQQEDPVANWVSGFVDAVKDCADIAALDALLAGKGKRYTDLETKRPELFAECEAAISEARTAMAMDHREGRTDGQHGDQFDGTDPA